jgi:putative addiction module component (TIGR02574 family)
MADQEITKRVLALPLTERVELAQALWQSIDEEPAPGSTAEERDAVEQAKRRDRELATGAVAGRTHEQVMKAARRALQ